MNYPHHLYLMMTCIGARFTVAIIAKYAPVTVLQLFGYLALFPAAMYSYLLITGARKGKGAFGQTIWLDYLRPIHAALYLLFAWFAIHKNRAAWLFLLADAVVGTIGFLIIHSKRGGFRSLL